MDTEAVPVSGVSGQDLPQRESNGHRQRGKEQRELTQVQPLCNGKATKKVDMEASFEVRLRRPFLEDPGRSRLKKGSSTRKKIQI